MTRTKNKKERELLSLNQKYKETHKFNIVKSLAKIPILAILLLISLFISFNILQPEYIGFVTAKAAFNYTDNVNLDLNKSYEYTWSIGNYGNLKSIRLDGTITKKGSAKVYLEHNKKQYLIFDSSRLEEESLQKITGLAVYDEIANNSTNNNAIAVSQHTQEKSITINLNGDNKKPTDEIFEFNISSIFNWDVDYNKLCTLWKINDISLCYGGEDCCNVLYFLSLFFIFLYL